MSNTLPNGLPKSGTFKDDYLVNMQEFSHLQLYTTSLVKLVVLTKENHLCTCQEYKQEHIIRGLTDI
jgi:hypothetical protein